MGRPHRRPTRRARGRESSDGGDCLLWADEGVPQAFHPRSTRRRAPTIFGVRWVVEKTADVMHRSRLVAKEIKTCNAPEVFAAPPPIDHLKCMLMRAAQDGHNYLMHADAARAYFHTDASRTDYD